MTSKRVAYVVNHAAFFVSHRLALAASARTAGFQVCLMTGQAGSQEMERDALLQLKASGVAHHRAVFSSSGTNPFIELVGLIQLVWFIFRFRPDIVHCASPKGVLYGGIAARICGVQGLLLAVSGMGYAYTPGAEKRGLRSVALRAYEALAGYAFHHRNVTVIVQNQDDYDTIISKRLANPSSLRLIPGSGVDLSLFEGCDAANKSRVVLLPSRMLRDKGVEEFVAAARSVKAAAPEWRFVMAGAAGYDNPSAIGLAQLKSWHSEGCIEWLGHVRDMTPLLREAAIVCLPSYREGMPKALLEAAAAGCAVVTTDVTGCRDAIISGVTGDLVPARNSDLLADALLSLIKDESRRQAYGENGLKRARALFSINSVIDRTMIIYNDMLDKNKKRF
jgi:glycosyltransferase involved in cell wall biosynthesis